MYKVAIIYTGELYNKSLNSIKLEELKGNIEIIGIGCEYPYANKLDGWKVTSLEQIMVSEWDYLLVGGNTNFVQIKNLLGQLGLPLDKIFSINIFNIPGFDFVEYIRLYESRVSIIARNCWGGLTYHALGHEFLTPFINLSFGAEEYLDLLEHLKEYLKCELSLKEYGIEPNSGVRYPIGKLGDITIYFNHYKTFEEAKEKWEYRLEKINWDNLFVMTYATSIDEVKRFDKLPYDKKVCFVPFETDIPSAVYVGMFNSTINNDFNRTWEIVNNLAQDKMGCYNILKMLNGEKDFMR